MASTTRNSLLYIHVMEILKEKILKEEYKVGDFIPTEVNLEKQFNVSKITIRKAIELLEIEGYVVKKSGKGTIVLSNSVVNKLSKAESFSSILKIQGHFIKKEVEGVQLVKNNVDSEFYRYFGEKCIKITRIYYLDDTPYIYFEHYITNKVNLESGNIDNNSSLYTILYNNEIMVKKFEDEFFVDPNPGKEVILKLNLNNEPVLGRKRKAIDSNGNVVEVSYAKYNTKVHNYVVNYEV